MITTCTHCNARYRLDGEKVPRRVIRVRCPGCQGVFQLDGAAESQEPVIDSMPQGFITGFQTESGNSGLNVPTSPATPELNQDAAPAEPAAPIASVPPVASSAPAVPAAPAEPDRLMASLDPVPSAQLDTPAAPAKTGGRRRRSTRRGGDCRVGRFPHAEGGYIYRRIFKM